MNPKSNNKVKIYQQRQKYIEKDTQRFPGS